jgi:L-ascorbate metabolism protein UlaG (beta-lactamase superfamily)
MVIDNIRWFGHDAFQIVDQGKVIYIDPWKMPKNANKADYIFITHSHYDHYSPEDVQRLRQPTTKIFAAHDVARKEGALAISMLPNQNQEFDLLKVTTIPAYNINKKFHPKENNWVGYIITLSDGTSVYHAGDTDFIPEMRTLQVDIALLPISGTYVMTADEAAEAANTFKPKVVIPMHHGSIVGKLSDADIFKAGFKGETVIK